MKSVNTVKHKYTVFNSLTYDAKNKCKTKKKIKKEIQCEVPIFHLWHKMFMHGLNQGLLGD